jgi:predicted aldo/keto reductase-like oxidoreductase
MSNMQHVEENVAVAHRASVGKLTSEEMPLFDRVRSKYQALTAIPCTSCDYCMPCPNEVNIPANFGIYNDGLMYDKPDGARGQYGWMLRSYEIGISDSDQRATHCIQCGDCEVKCPQDIPISEWMPVIHEVLGENQPYVRELT